MVKIRFTSEGVDKTITVDVAPGERPTLLAVARNAGVPILFNCEAGDCGACLVHVDTHSTGQRGVAPLTENENLLLQTMCMLTAKEIEAAEREGVPPDVRLACQYVLRDEEIVVYFERHLGSQ